LIVVVADSGLLNFKSLVKISTFERRYLSPFGGRCR